MNLKEFCSHLENSSDYYDVSDGFMIDGYMQGVVDGKIIKFNGYIRKAKNEGKIDETTRKVSQKWHLFYSYLPGYEDRDAPKCYNRLRCPELLLWIAEASGVNDDYIKKATTKAKETIDKKGSRYGRCSAASEIRGIIPWSIIEANLLGID